jgi:hypothetical protein
VIKACALLRSGLRPGLIRHRPIRLRTRRCPLADEAGHPPSARRPRILTCVYGFLRTSRAGGIDLRITRLWRLLSRQTSRFGGQSGTQARVLRAQLARLRGDAGVGSGTVLTSVPRQVAAAVGILIPSSVAAPQRVHLTGIHLALSVGRAVTLAGVVLP